MATHDDTAPKGSTGAVVRLRQRAQEAAERIEQRAAETPIQLFLPGLEDVLRAMPNHIARSSLFAPVARGRKKLHDGTLIVSRADSDIRFSGRQLDEAQADVWMQCMHEATKHTLGEPIKINRAAFLRAIGRNTSGENYRWLHRTMQDLAFAMLVIEVRKDGKPKLRIGRTRALHMIEGFDYHDDTETYTLHIDPRWKAMYAGREFALIDWDKRLQFGTGQDMAKALQRLVAASADSPQRYRLDWLKAKLEYSGRVRDFRAALTKATGELQRLEIITRAKIEDSTKGQPQLVLWLPADHQAGCHRPGGIAS